MGCDLKEFTQVPEALHARAEQFRQVGGQFLKGNSGNGIHVETYGMEGGFVESMADRAENRLEKGPGRLQ